MNRVITAGVAGLASAALALSAAPAVAAPRPIGDVQKALEVLAAGDMVVGAIGSVYRDGREIGTGTAGSRLLNDQGGKIPSDARYRVGSQTKLMVAVVLLQLVAEGKLGVDDKLSDVLPEVADQDLVERADEITVRQLIQHTSGIPNYFAKGVVDVFDFTTYHPPAELVRRARGLPRQAEPGEVYSYSNTNYVLLGMIIQRLTGHTLADELDRRVFAPLGMKDTYLPTKPPEGIKGPHGHGYTPDETGKLIDMDRINASLLWAAGSTVSTSDDISAFQRAFIRGELLPPELQEVIGGGGSDGGGERPCAGELEITGPTGGTAGFNATTYTTTDGRLQFAISTTLTYQDNEALKQAKERAVESVLCPEK